MHSTVLAMIDSVCLSDRPAVCLSQPGIMSKWLKLEDYSRMTLVSSWLTQVAINSLFYFIFICCFITAEVGNLCNLVILAK